MRWIKKAVNYFREVLEEMRKVTWPSRQQTLRYSAMVIGISVVVGVFFTVLDFVFNFGLEELLKLQS